jgi:hypothetical protein
LRNPRRYGEYAAVGATALEDATVNSSLRSAGLRAIGPITESFISILGSAGFGLAVPVIERAAPSLEETEAVGLVGSATPAPILPESGYSTISAPIIVEMQR